MTVKDLIDELSKYPSDHEVKIFKGLIGEVHPVEGVFMDRLCIDDDLLIDDDKEKQVVYVTDCAH